MNRRDFLKSILALTVVAGIAPAVALAEKSKIRARVGRWRGLKFIVDLDTGYYAWEGETEIVGVSMVPKIKLTKNGNYEIVDGY